MARRKIGPGDWIVVCDGRKAMILENTGDAKFLNLRMKEIYEHPDEPTHVQGTDAPGRSHQSLGHHRSAVEQTDWHDQSERAFLSTLAGHLAKAVADGRTRALTMLAPPRAMGMIRQAYSPTLRGAIVHEIAKDVVRMPIPDIEQLLVRGQ